MLPVYPIFEEEKSKASDEKSVVKNRIKKTNRTNIIATNFVREQLIYTFRKYRKVKRQINLFTNFDSLGGIQNLVIAKFLS